MGLAGYKQRTKEAYLSINIPNTLRFSVFAALLAGMTLCASAASISYTGNFVNDNDVQTIGFSLLSATTVTLETFGYGGGTNANGDLILPGGFESTLQLFALPSGFAVGGSILPGPDPSCGPRTADPSRFNFCFDAYAQVFLTPGDYIVALTQNSNTANGNLGDGFQFDSDPNFSSGFVGTFGYQGTSQWALDITSPDAVVGAPEPGSALLALSAFLLAGLGIRKRVR
jgi:hypothetical protein